MRFTERVMWEMELAAAREGMLNTKGKQLPDPLQLDVTSDLHISDMQVEQNSLIRIQPTRFI